MTTEETKPIDGVGIGMGMALFGVVLLGLPLLLDITGTWLTLLFCVALVFAFGGLGGAFLDLEKVRKQPGWSEVGTAAVLLGLAAAALVIRLREDLWPWVAVLLVILLLFLVFFALIGGFMGMLKLAKVGEAVREGGRAPLPAGGGALLTRAEKINLTVTVVCAVVTTVASVLTPFLQQAP